MNQLSSLLTSGARIIGQTHEGNQESTTCEPPCSKYDIPSPKELPLLKNIKILGGQSTHQSYSTQDYFTIRESHATQGRLFEDREFPPVNSSLNFSGPMNRTIRWKRPHEIVDNPQFISSSWKRSFIQQGELGERWVAGAAANLAANPFLFANVVSEDQSFTEKYAGVFHFRFWQYGKWLDVVIDDQLPTYEGKLLFMHAPGNHEFWSALMEKAYAKLYGSYEALRDTTVCEALEDFTGGIIESYDLQSKFDAGILLEAFQKSAIIVCSKNIAPDVNTPGGITTGMCYGVTKIIDGKSIFPDHPNGSMLMRLRYPYGVQSSWNGAFGTKSPEWRSLTTEQKAQCDYDDEDTEFWIALNDVVKNFDRIEICHLHPDSVSDDDLARGRQKWDISVFEGIWTLGVSSGGCRDFPTKFWKNPQYFVTIGSEANTTCSVVIGLTQKFKKSYKEGRCHHIGFSIYHILDGAAANGKLDQDFFNKNISVARSSSFVNIKEVTNRFRLPPGRYCIIPSTFNPDDEGEFVLRVFAERILKKNLNGNSSFTANTTFPNQGTSYDKTEHDATAPSNEAMQSSNYGEKSVPSYGGTSAPSYGGPAAPLYGGSAAPPYVGTTAPPYGGPSVPPYGGPSVPPYGGPSVPPYGGPSVPPYGGSAVPPYGGSAIPPYGGTSVPPYGSMPVPHSEGTLAPPYPVCPYPMHPNEFKGSNSNIGWHGDASSTDANAASLKLYSKSLEKKFLEKYGPDAKIDRNNLKLILDAEMKETFGLVESTVKGENAANEEDDDNDDCMDTACTILMCVGMVVVCILCIVAASGSKSSGSSTSNTSYHSRPRRSSWRRPRSYTSSSERRQNATTTNTAVNATIPAQKIKIYPTFTAIECQEILALFDTTRRGSLSFVDFQKLAEATYKWITVFKSYDYNKEGKLSSSNFKPILVANKCYSSDYLVESFITKHADRDKMFLFPGFLVSILKSIKVKSEI